MIPQSFPHGVVADRWRGHVRRQKTMQLAAALAHEDDELCEAARHAVRGFIDRIVIPPGVTCCGSWGIWVKC